MGALLKKRHFSSVKQPHKVSPGTWPGSAVAGTPAGLTVVSVLGGHRVLLPLPFAVLLAVGAVVPVALAHQRHPHAHVQGPVAWENRVVAAIGGSASTATPGGHRGRAEPQGPARFIRPKNPTATSLNVNFRGSLTSPDLSFFLSLFYSSFAPRDGLGSPKCALKAPKPFSNSILGWTTPPTLRFAH